MGDVGILKILHNEPSVASKKREFNWNIEENNVITTSWTIPKGSYHIATSCYI